MTLQPFVNYNFPDGWYVTSSPIITADWETGHGDRWTVPIGGGFGRVFKMPDVLTRIDLIQNVLRCTIAMRTARGKFQGCLRGCAAGSV